MAKTKTSVDESTTGMNAMFISPAFIVAKRIAHFRWSRKSANSSRQSRELCIGSYGVYNPYAYGIGTFFRMKLRHAILRLPSLKLLDIVSYSTVEAA